MEVATPAPSMSKAPTGFPTGFPTGLAPYASAVPSAAAAPAATAGTAAASTAVKYSSTKVFMPAELRQMLKEKRFKTGPVKARKKQGLGFPVKIKDHDGPFRACFGTMDRPLTAPFGVKMFESNDPNEQKSGDRLDLDVGISPEKNPEEYGFGLEWDDWTLDQFAERSEDCFGEPRSREAVKVNFTRTVRPPAPPKDPVKRKNWDAEKAKEWDALQRFKVVTTGDNKTLIYKITGSFIDAKGVKMYKRKPAAYTDIGKFSKCVINADCIGGFMTGYHGISWQATTVVFFPAEDSRLPSEIPTGENEGFCDDNDDDDNDDNDDDDDDADTGDVVDGNGASATVPAAAAAATSMPTPVPAADNDGPTVIAPVAAPAAPAVAPPAALAAAPPPPTALALPPPPPPTTEASPGGADANANRKRKHFDIPNLDDDDDEMPVVKRTRISE